MQYTAVYAPVTCEEIAMNVIKIRILLQPASLQ